MFIRDRPSVMHDREIGGRLRVGHYAVLVVVAAVFESFVVARISLINASGPWSGIAIAGAVILAAAVACLVLAVKRIGPFRS